MILLRVLRTPLVEWNSLARAEIPQVGNDLCSNCHGRRPDSTNNSAVLFQIENAAALRVTLQIVGPRLQQDDQIPIVLHPNGN